jgi:hypothetical protein
MIGFRFTLIALFVLLTTTGGFASAANSQPSENRDDEATVAQIIGVHFARPILRGSQTKPIPQFDVPLPVVVSQQDSGPDVHRASSATIPTPSLVSLHSLLSE